MQVRHGSLFSGLFDYTKGKIIKSFYNLKYKDKELNIDKRATYKGPYISKILILKDGNILCVAKFTYTIFNGKTFEIIKEKELENYLKYFSYMIQLDSSHILFYDKKFNFGVVYFDNNYTFDNAIITSLKSDNNFLPDVGLNLLSNGKIAYIEKTQFFYEYKKGKIYILNLNKKTNNIFIETIINAQANIFFEIKSKNVYLISFDENNISLLNAKNYGVIKKYNFHIENNMKIIKNEKFLVQGEKNGEIKIYNLDNFKLVKSYVSNKINEFNNIYTPLNNNIFFTKECQPIDEISEYYIKKYKYDEEKNEIICIGYFSLIVLNSGLIEILDYNDEENLYFLIYSDAFELIKTN